MSTFFSKPRRSGGMAGELARKARGAAFVAGPQQPRRVGGRSSMIRLSVPREDSGAWTDKMVARATTLAHWVSSRGQSGGQGGAAAAFLPSDFAVSAWPSA